MSNWRILRVRKKRISSFQRRNQRREILSLFAMISAIAVCSDSTATMIFEIRVRFIFSVFLLRKESTDSAGS